MPRRRTILFSAILTMAAATTLYGDCDGCKSGCSVCTSATRCTTPGCRAAGRCCGGPTCVGKAELVDVEKHCWNIEGEKICVPAVRFPWEHGGSKLKFFHLFKFKRAAECADCACHGAGCESCVAPKCGFVVAVRKLKKETYDVKECAYSLVPAENNPLDCDCTGASTGQPSAHCRRN